MTSRDSHLRRSYGITEAEYNSMLKKQKGVCALCGSPPKAVSLHVDHEHVKGYKKLSQAEKKQYVRGILCYRCNKFKVGRLDLEWARKILEYLETHGRNINTNPASKDNTRRKKNH